MRIALLIVTIVSLHTAAYAQPSAENLYMEGQAAYDRADYKTAVDKWQASYDVSKESSLLFNLAQAKRLAGDCTGAIATYRSFIATNANETETEQHKLAKDLVRELEATCPQQKPGVITPPKLVAEPTSGAALHSAPGITDRRSDDSRSGRTWKIAGLVTGGVGVVTIAIGFGLGHHGASLGDEVTAACATSCDWEVQKGKEERGKRAVAIGKVLDGVGIAAIAGGAIFYYLGVRQETLTVAPATSGNGGVISWSGSW